MIVLSKDVNIDIGNKINDKPLIKLENKFEDKFEELLDFRDDPSSKDYRRLLTDLWNIQDQKELLAGLTLNVSN